MKTSMTLATGQVMIFLSKRLTRSQTRTSMIIYGNQHEKNTLLIMISNHHQKISNHHQKILNRHPKMLSLLLIEWNLLLALSRLLKQMEISFKMWTNLDMLYHPQRFPPLKSVLKQASFLVLIVLTDASFTTSIHPLMKRSVPTHGNQ